MIAKKSSTKFQNLSKNEKKVDNRILDRLNPG